MVHFALVLSFAVGSTIGLFFLYISSTTPKAGKKGEMFAMFFAIFSFMGAIVEACEFRNLYLNNDLEDKHYPDKDKIVEIGNICAKM